MKKLILITLFAAGCGTILNKRVTHVELDPGVSIDGATMSTEIDQRERHIVTYADGRTCEPS